MKNNLEEPKASLLGKIKKICKDFMTKLDWESDINVEITEKMIYVKIETEEPQLLIGRGGETLEALQHLLRIVINNQLGEFLNIIVDINDYKNKQREFLEADSVRKAEWVKKTGKEIELRPMNSFERRIVHMALKDFFGVVAESEGEGRDRKIVIRPEM
jgi:spoIIIJ-associated protein